MLRVGWEKNLSGSEASYTDGSSYVSKLFFLLSLDLSRWKVAGGCSLNGTVFFPQRVWTALIGYCPAVPGWIPLTFPGAVGVSLILQLDVASLLCLIKENK